MKFSRFFPTCLFFFATISLTAQYVEYGEAAWYSDKLHGKVTASGEKYDKNKLTAAHRTLPVGSIIRITRLDNNRSVNVRVNDCGPHNKNRIVDLSRAAAEEVGLVRDGVARVRIELITLGQGPPACGKTDPMLPNEYSYTAGGTPRGIPTGYDAPLAQQPRMMVPLLPDGAYRAAALRPYTAGYAVQVASFSKYENAMNKVEELEKKGFSDILVNFDNNATFKVLLGPFDTETLANSYMNNLQKNHKIKGFVVNLYQMNLAR